jgi:hypothetical protein
LPHSGVHVVTSAKMFVRANGDAADPNPVLPDILIKQKRTGDDTVLEYAKNWVRG